LAGNTVVVIPACNEAERIGPVLDAVRAVLPGARIVVVDDGSGDATAATARRHGAVVLSHPFNLGYGAALQTGYHYARHHGAERLLQLDADGQHDPASIPDLLRALDDGADLVIGSRYLPGYATPRTSLLRRIGTRLFSAIVTWWTGIRVTDPTSGYQAMSRRAIELLVLDHFPEDYPDADMLITAARSGLRLAEVPACMHERVGGLSMHRGGRAAYYVYKMFLNLALLPIRRPSPFRDGRSSARIATDSIARTDAARADSAAGAG
jgi:glycosyltransferase involved in cell wall biosynthesis